MPLCFIDLPQAQVEYASFGTRAPERSFCLLLHEGLGCVELWKDFPHRLAETLGREVGAYSRRGYGRSSSSVLPRPINYLEHQACEELRQVLDALRHDSVILIGHSDGATIALAYAAQYADPRVRGVVAMAPHVFAEPRCIEAIRTTTRRYAGGDLRDGLKRYHGDNVDVAFHGWSDTWLSPDFVDWDITPMLDGIRSSLLLIQGEEDEYASGQHLERVRQHAKGRCSTVWLPMCGHTPQRESQGETIRAIAEFVDDIDR
ncbi:Pimeloyl-ACP methyl ester carboxylesterase [Chromohalobacter canadensis]|uniref:Pimeloyl-ACP methyl ester carboxylesterase n=1 Tax=Chromohalobacter canadensis TaxID=141389 RepID=A0A285VD46_9GAMM|nr:alpha/beta hydrolase [Chromohalobacter canadensis]SOC50986.1 Pimeloyl-ACP methyl ester carboxylesterase [Chromohalobacter canadensis]